MTNKSQVTPSPKELTQQHELTDKELTAISGGADIKQTQTPIAQTAPAKTTGQVKGTT